MEESLATRKKKLREQMQKERDRLPAADKDKLDKDLVHKLHELIEQRVPKSVHCYLPMGSEVDISPVIESLLQSGTRVITPKSLPKRKLEHLVLKSTHELEDGIFGTRHPSGGLVFGGSYDMIIVPGLAFDRQGNRLGYGAGYYDSFLQEQAGAYKVGVAYPFQVLKQLPTEAHDVPLNKVLY